MQCFSRVVCVQVAYAELLQTGDEVFVSHPAFVSRLGTGVSEPDAAAALYAEVSSSLHSDCKMAALGAQPTRSPILAARGW